LNGVGIVLALARTKSLRSSRVIALEKAFADENKNLIVPYA